MAGTSDAGDIRSDVRGQIGAFLSTRRARISPAQAGLPVYRGEHRRVPGLRREEVAVLAGISTEYYIRFERGNATGVSDSVIDGIAHALQLDDAERGAPARPDPDRRPHPPTAPPHVRPTVPRIIDSMTGTPKASEVAKCEHHASMAAAARVGSGPPASRRLPATARGLPHAAPADADVR
jgi:transcriptional regulator with XRE-family HTH domain